MQLPALGFMLSTGFIATAAAQDAPGLPTEGEVLAVSRGENPKSGVLRRQRSAHQLFNGCGDDRQYARTGGGLSLRPRTDGHVQTGLLTLLNRPLDFLAVSDHAGNLGLAPAIAESNPKLLKNEWGKMEHDLARTGGLEGASLASSARPDSQLIGHRRPLAASSQRIHQIGEGKFCN